MFLLVLAVAMLVASLFVPAEPVLAHVTARGRVLYHTETTWRTILLLILRAGGLAVLLAAALSQQRTVETIDDVIRDESATIPYDRTAGVDARGNSAVTMDEPRPWRGFL